MASRISTALAEDELVCVFPEGKLTEDGQMSPFKPGVMRILERDPVTIVPLALRGLWGSFFSRAHGKAMSRLFPRGLLSRIELVAGDVITESTVGLENLQQRVAALRGERPWLRALARIMRTRVRRPSSMPGPRRGYESETGTPHQHAQRDVSLRVLTTNKYVLLQSCQAEQPAVRVHVAP